MTQSFPPLATTVTGSGPGLLLAHGAGGSIRANYGALIPALARQHTVVAPDYPGSGATPRAAGPLTLDGLADALVASATGAGVETCTVIGFSAGTLVSVRAAARHPERVRGLVLTAGLARPDNRLTASLDLWRTFLTAGDLGAFARFTVLTGFSQEFLNDLPSDLIPPLYELTAETLPAGALEQSTVIREADTTGDLPGISIPTLVIAATHDTLISPANSRMLANGIPGAEYAEIETGHLVMSERPEDWQKLIQDFLDRHGL